MVCGAPNIRVGQMVPYAGPGAVLPSGLKIEETEIKGVLSPGMLCSEKELGLGEDASGILVFDRVLRAGAASDRSFSVHRGYHSRDICDAEPRGLPFDPRHQHERWQLFRETHGEVPRFSWKKGRSSADETSPAWTSRTRISVPRYVARLVEGVTIGPSPFEIRFRLTRAGVRPISNVVDATNLILLECGQPLHAFDLTSWKTEGSSCGAAIRARRLRLWTESKASCRENALMIRDGKRSVALAGIMGGLNSEIKAKRLRRADRERVFRAIRNQADGQGAGNVHGGLFRFERGVDPEGTLWAAHRAAHLIRKLAGGTILSGHIDVYPTPITRPAVPCQDRQSKQPLGIQTQRRRDFIASGDAGN